LAAKVNLHQRNIPLMETPDAEVLLQNMEYISIRDWKI
jgi:hypothetical protein